MQISLFIRERVCEPRGKLRLNPYIAIGRWFELAIDSDGFLICIGRRSFGFIRGAGWHTERSA